VFSRDTAYASKKHSVSNGLINKKLPELHVCRSRHHTDAASILGMPIVRVANVAVGLCASSLVQGVEYFKNAA